MTVKVEGHGGNYRVALGLAGNYDLARDIAVKLYRVASLEISVDLGDPRNLGYSLVRVSYLSDGVLGEILEAIAEIREGGDGIERTAKVSLFLRELARISLRECLYSGVCKREGLVIHIGCHFLGAEADTHGLKIYRSILHTHAGVDELSVVIEVHSSVRISSNVNYHGDMSPLSAALHVDGKI